MFAYTAPITQAAFMNQNAHPLQVLCCVAAFTIAAAIVFAAWADQYQRPSLLDRALSIAVARGVSPYLAMPVHVVRALESRPLLRPMLAPPTAVFCDKTNRWRCATTRKFIKAPAR